ncbi:MAG: ATP-binding protein [Deltaproteobacteria bacterium]|nr:ATP-binding protein [Deltaproteobacteria bacterium]MBN2845990.1 ATP-binding protein [Deltaproteobacteria bacterium]
MKRNACVEDIDYRTPRGIDQSVMMSLISCDWVRRCHNVIITGQLPIDHWHEQIDDPTIADAILDRLVHNVHEINLSMKGESMRKNMPP